MKIGKREQEILDFIRCGSVEIVDLVAEFAPLRRKAGERNSSKQAHVVINRLVRMAQKGLIHIEHGRVWRV